MKTKRIFVAIKIDNTDQINELFRQVGFDLNEERIKWVNKNGLHITLLFLGETGVEEITMITNKLKTIGANLNAFRLNLKSLGAFPSIEHPRILWTGINSTSGLYKLQENIRIHLEKSKVREDYKYTPHLTIGRIKGGVENPERIKECLLKWKDWQDSELLITEFVLMESLLTQQGPVYKVLEIFSLKNQNV
ncbi:RNA 2',3'-cyclic phosphodiesterase [Labilibaculum sp. K2S]|uniref:RNA 2',3'-cyclic phosphodiesterase n=1 Tax=Labilibaculum sp. K2S TaxID=3056386 RepID=UPI0025A4A22A|nr:RNA 2',3'-cyclic phosphodiesterase [Labilibaculum sp. K2S]MDM8161706.1 RNA 2',3'-cyclic phosphodiesterase [Labilibaculum sp. K2S]